MGEEVGGGGGKEGKVYKQLLPLTSSLCHSQGVGFLNDDMEGFAWCLSPYSSEPYAWFCSRVNGALASLCGEFLMFESFSGVV
jgi:hypothetical protein